MQGILLNNICQISEIILIDFGHQSVVRIPEISQNQFMVNI